MLGPIRTYFFEREKRKRLSASAKRSSHFKKDRKNHFGILLDAGVSEDCQAVIAFTDELRKEGQRVKVLGYREGKTEGLHLPFDFFTSAELAKISKAPRSPLVEAFIEQPFDVLINMSIKQDHKALDYIATLSKATFRIGPWYPHLRENPYDLSLDAGPGTTLQEWIRELMHTLQKIY